MRITPVGNNYTNQKAQRSNNQQNFGMVPDTQTLEAYIKALNPEVQAHFWKQMAQYGSRIGKITHNGQEILARIEFMTVARRRRNISLFRVVASSGGETKNSANFLFCECNGGIAAKRLYNAYMNAGCQFQFRELSQAPQTPQQITAKIVAGCKAHDPSQRM